MKKSNMVYCLNISSGNSHIPFAKGTVLWSAWYWPWAKVSVHEVDVRWIKKSLLHPR